MPINLSYEAMQAKEKYENSETLSDKIRSLQEYLALIPDHKGTDNLRQTLKTKLSKLKAESDEARLRRKGTGVQFHLKKEGDAQVVLVGLSSSGKSSMLAALTSAKPEIGVPTSVLTPGMIDYEGVQIQAVEVPAIFEDASQSVMGRQSLGAVRNADLVIMIIDLMRDPLDQLTLILNEFENTGIKLNKTPPPVEIKKTGSGGIQIIGDIHLENERQDVVQLLFENGIHNAVVTISGKIRLEDIVESLDRSIIYLNGIIVCTKGDVKGSVENFNGLKDSPIAKRFPLIVPTSVMNEEGMKNVKTLPPRIFHSLGLIRVYTKDDVKGVAKRPMVLRGGVTVKNLTKMLHKDFFQHFKHAKVWGTSVKHSGAQVGLTHTLEDADVIQVYTK
ncbi:MAG: TGS domain-containing protein [Candidatus Lokiarchaeota archaeon]|nr:TGS domain-containing protein [Candidatus Lokiarchaeota archaeon]